MLIPNDCIELWYQAFGIDSICVPREDKETKYGYDTLINYFSRRLL
jgi:hypothetical protein